MMTRDDPDRAMIQIQLWWLQEIQIERWSRSSSDDLDWEMIQIQIQIEWWSRSSSMTIQMERWSRSRWLEDEYDLKTKMTWRWRCSSWYREEDQCWKSCRKNTFLVKRECWCICNSECILLCILCIVTRCLFWDVSIMYLSHVFMPRCSDRED